MYMYSVCIHVSVCLFLDKWERPSHCGEFSSETNRRLKGRNWVNVLHLQRRISLPTSKGEYPERITYILKQLQFSVHLIAIFIIYSQIGHWYHCVCMHVYVYFQVLAIYTFSKRTYLDDFENKPRKSVGYSTVSHFNIIHVDCHTAAVRWDKTRWWTFSFVSTILFTPFLLFISLN